MKLWLLDSSGASSHLTRDLGSATVGSVSKSCLQAAVPRSQQSCCAVLAPQSGSPCTWFSFLSTTTGVTLGLQVDVFEPQSQLHTEGFQSLKEGDAVELTFQKSPKGLESLQLPVMVGVLCGE